MDFVIRFLAVLLLIALSNFSELAGAAPAARRAIAVQQAGPAAEAQEQERLAEERRRLAEEEMRQAQAELEAHESSLREIRELLAEGTSPESVSSPVLGQDLEELKGALEEFRKAIGDDGVSPAEDSQGLTAIASLEEGNEFGEDERRLRTLQVGFLFGDYGSEYAARQFRLGEADPGHWIEGRFQLPPDLAPGTPLKLIAVKEDSAIQYLAHGEGGGIQTDGSFRIKIDPDVPEGWLKLDGGNLVFRNLPKFSVRNGRVTLTGDFAPRVGGVVRVHLKDRDGKPVSGATLKSVLAGNRAVRTMERRFQDLSRIGRELPQVGGHPSGPSKYLVGPLLPASPVKIEVHCGGYAERIDAIDSVPIRPNEIVDMEIILDREVPIHVTVMDPSGDIRLGDHVALWNPTDLDNVGISNFRTSGKARKFYGRGPGSYVIRLTGDEIRTKLVPITILQDSEGPFQVRVVAEPKLGVQGTVVWADGSPVAKARVWVRPFVERNFSLSQDPDQHPRFFANQALKAKLVRTDGEGRFRAICFDDALFFEVLGVGTPEDLDLPEGLSRSKVLSLKRRKRVMGLSGRVAVDGEPVTLVLGEAPKGLHGRVVDGAGKAVASYQIKAYSNLYAELLQRALVLNHISKRNFGKPVSLNVLDSEGRFDMAALQSGTWCLQVTANGFVSKVHAGATPGDAPTMITMKREASLCGVVVGPDGSQPKRIHLTACLDSSPPIEETFGPEFHWQGLAPGEYEVTARAEGFGRSEAQLVSLKAGETSPPLEFSLTRLEDVSGTLCGRLREVYLTHWPLVVRVEDTGRSVKVDSEGRFVLQGLEAGQHNLQLAIPASSGQPDDVLLGYQVTVEVEAGQSTQVHLQAEPGSIIVDGSVLEAGVVADQGYLYFETIDRTRIFGAPIEGGSSRLLLPPGTPMNVFLGTHSTDLFGDKHFWLEHRWGTPQKDTIRAWETPIGRMRIEYVDASGAPFAWFEGKPPTILYCHPDREVPAFGAMRTVGPDGIIDRLLPGGMYRLQTGSRDAHGRMAGVTSARFTVPVDGSIGVIKAVVGLFNPDEGNGGVSKD